MAWRVDDTLDPAAVIVGRAEADRQNGENNGHRVARPSRIVMTITEQARAAPHVHRAAKT